MATRPSPPITKSPPSGFRAIRLPGIFVIGVALRTAHGATSPLSPYFHTPIKRCPPPRKNPSSSSLLASLERVPRGPRIDAPAIIFRPPGKSFSSLVAHLVPIPVFGPALTHVALPSAP